MSEQKSNLPETLTWTAPAFQIQHRPSGWYLGFALVSIGLIAFAIYDGSIITMITFVLLILIVLTLSFEKPRQTTYKITRTGIHIGNNVYEYKVIKLFWIIYRPPQVKTLNFETTAYINNKVSVQLGSQDPVMVKMVLAQYIPEDLNRDENIAEVLARRLKI